ncbi:MAG TPA: prolyl oligopeptidase family serine peptidase, partial [Caulifigura sp.]|nr:prolyl oligopeptidase family serine peptidase [Caulifigura sp.]
PRAVEIPTGLRPRSERPRGAGETRVERRTSTSPDGKWKVATRDFNLFLQNQDDMSESALTQDGVEADQYGRGLYWSPDSRFLVAMKTQPAETHTVNIVESSPKDQVQPKLVSFDYLKPGDQVEVSKPRLFDIGAKKAVGLDESLYSTPFAIRDVRWDSDSARFTFAYNQRGHQVFRVLAVDAATGAVRPIVDEQSPTFIDYSGKQFRHDLKDRDEMIWMSERDGWNHLYLIDSRTGAVKNQITRGEWVVRGVERVDDAKRQVWFMAGGLRPGQDPYYVHYARVNFDGSGLTILTEGDGQHTAEFAPDGETFVDTWSRVDKPPVTELRRTSDGSLVCVIEEADWEPLLKTGWEAPERFSAKGRDGATDIYGVIWRPTNFDPMKKYPVIENIYAGPQSAFVPKSFRPFYGQQKIAELGFIVVQMDGMGTSHRSKAFHDTCWKNIGDAGFPDRIAWIKAAAKLEPAMDLDRVGIYGGSAGGQNSTRAMLAHGDFYKVAVSDCGCHDNRMDKIWWNEQWMGWPIGDHYVEQSNVTQAHKLKGKLMLVVGELDRNVDPASTMQVANALIKADKDFDLVIIPGAGHGACETPYGQRRRQDFFVRHLLGVEPRAN